MRFGTFLLMQSASARSSQEIYGRGIEVAQAAEALGFRSVWLAEHHFSTYGYLSRPAQLATYIAAKTTRLRVGTAVIVVPLHHPLVVAEEIATLDLLAGGRVDIGLGRGYQHYEFERLGLELETGRARWEESVDVILKALEGRPFTYDGKIFKIPETTIFPLPMQQPRPPIWITAQSPDSVEGAVRRGFNVLTGGFGVPLERMAEFRKLFDRVVAEAKPAQPPQAGLHGALHVAHHDPRGRRAGALEHARDAQPAQQLPARRGRSRDPGARPERAERRRAARPLPGHRHARYLHPTDQADRGRGRDHALQLLVLVRRPRARAGASVHGDVRA